MTEPLNTNSSASVNSRNATPPAIKVADRSEGSDPMAFDVRAASGAIWISVETATTQVTSFIVFTVMARFLSAPEFGPVSQSFVPLLSVKVILLEQIATDHVARVLRTQVYACLPFPDGATDKRGSLLAVLANGVRVVAPLSDKSAPPIRDCIVPAQDHGEAARRLLKLVNHPANWPAQSAEAVAEYYSWDTIAARHETIYKTLLR